MGKSGACVYCKKKKQTGNKRGKYFGLVRYEEIKDQEWLENQLMNIWFESYKSWVNISKFERKPLHEARAMAVR